MACVFLEHITWFLLGLEGVKEFATKRMAPDKYTFDSDIFFTVSSDLKTADIKDPVRAWIKHLQDQPGCCEYLYNLLGLIENKMLVSNPENRILASDLHHRLKKLESYFAKSPSFYLKHWTESEYNSTSNKR